MTTAVYAYHVWGGVTSHCVLFVLFLVGRRSDMHFLSFAKNSGGSMYCQNVVDNNIVAKQFDNFILILVDY